MLYHKSKLTLDSSEEQYGQEDWNCRVHFGLSVLWRHLILCAYQWCSPVHSNGYLGGGGEGGTKAVTASRTDLNIKDPFNHILNGNVNVVLKKKTQRTDACRF